MDFTLQRKARLITRGVQGVPDSEIKAVAREVLQELGRGITDKIPRFGFALLAYLKRHHAGTYLHCLGSAKRAQVAVEILGFVGIDGGDALVIGLLFHDVGKIGVPTVILNLASGLSADEKALMRLHPELGGELTCRWMRPLARIVVSSHHEFGKKKEGRYPNEEPPHLPDPQARKVIPLAGPIDMVDALQQDPRGRPHRTTVYTPDEALHLVSLDHVIHDERALVAAAHLRTVSSAA